MTTETPGDVSLSRPRQFVEAGTRQRAKYTCSFCGTVAGHKMMKCACGAARYCDGYCSLSHWPEHGAVCAAAAAQEG